MPKANIFTQSNLQGTVIIARGNIQTTANITAEVTTQKREFTLLQEIASIEEKHFDIIQEIEQDTPGQIRITRVNA